MKTNYHFSSAWKTVGTKLDDGTGCVILGFTDKETGVSEVYPLHLSDAKSIAAALLKLVFKVKIRKKGS